MEGRSSDGYTSGLTFLVLMRLRPSAFAGFVPAVEKETLAFALLFVRATLLFFFPTITVDLVGGSFLIPLFLVVAGIFQLELIHS